MDLVTWSPGMSLETMERLVVKAAFKFYRGDKRSIANTLGISATELDAKIVKYDADDRKTSEHQRRLRTEREVFLRRERGIDPPPVITLAVENAPPDEDIMGEPVVRKTGTRGRR